MNGETFVMPRSWRLYVLNASGISYTISEGRYFLQNLRTIYKIYVSLLTIV